MEPNRIWGGKCSKSDIVINQGATDPLPSGIPTYTVEIMNVCVTGCDISAIHLSCGWFSSARLVNPLIFKRLRFDDCLVNDGKPLISGRTLSFQYANTFRYPLSVSSVICWNIYMNKAENSDNHIKLWSRFLFLFFLLFLIVLLCCFICLFPFTVGDRACKPSKFFVSDSWSNTWMWRERESTRYSVSRWL